jgi:pimeloyl-ACP methyl ester carboxylesterase
MSWLEQGEGLPVILLHGIPTSPELWRYVMPQLSGVRVLAWEMVGYGMSIEAGRARDLSVTSQAEYLAAWMRHLGIRNAIFAAHDLGGGVAQIAAVRHPQLCSGLFFTNAICYDSWPIPSVVAMRMSAPLMRRLPEPLFKLLLMNLFARGHDDPARARSAYQVHADHYLSADGAADLIRQMEFLDVNDTLAVADALSSLYVPARVVWGAADQFQKIRYGRRLAQDLGAPLRRIPGGKHFTPEDHPELLAEEIMALVRGVKEAIASEPAPVLPAEA